MGNMDNLQIAPYADMFGFNLRMTEISAAIVRAQLARRDELIGRRVYNAVQLATKLREEVPGLKPQSARPFYTHTHYVLPILFEEDVWGVHRDKVVAAVKAELMPCAGREYEGVTIGAGYIKPIHMMPVFQSRGYQSSTPICDDLWRNRLIVTHRFFGPNAVNQDLQDVVDAFMKVWDNREELA
jgi:perosamine synthetase